MTYRVGLVQNESELLRYSHADIFDLISSYGYFVEQYTAENINNLYNNYKTYDALIFATNALLSRVTLEFFQKKDEVLNHFIEEKNKGVLFLFQMKFCELSDCGIKPLKEHFNLSFKKSVQGPESGRHLLAKNHGTLDFLLNSPNSINIDEIEYQCYNNKNTDGLYWGYISEHSESLIPLVCDQSEEKKVLFLTTENPHRGRVTFSMLVLDWQQHLDFLENTVRHVVEGPPNMAIIMSSNLPSLELTYLMSVLSSHKIRFQTYKKENASLDTVPLNLHVSFVFDPLFSPSDVHKALQQTQLHDTQTVLFFDRRTGVPGLIYSRYAQHSLSRAMSQKLQVVFNDYYETGSWCGSFWTTFDVLQCANLLHWPIAHYVESITQFVGKKRLLDGSYDNVFGATCALLEIYHWLGLHKSKQFSETAEWIKKQLPDMDLFSRAVAYETFYEASIDHFRQSQKEKLVQDILEEAPTVTNRLILARYIQVLILTKNLKKADIFLSKLRNEFPSNSMYHKAEFCIYAANLMKEDPTYSHRWLPEIRTEIETIFDELHRHQHGGELNIDSASKGLQALKKFDEIFPVPSTEWIEYEARRTTDLSAIADNSRVYEKLISQQIIMDKLEVEHREITAYRLAMLFVLGPVFSASIFLGILVYFGNLDELVKFYNEWKSFLKPVGMFIAGSVCVWYAMLLSKWKLMPDWVYNAYDFTQKKLTVLLKKEVSSNG